MPIVEGVLERITYKSEQTGYTIIKVRPKASASLVTVVGYMEGIAVGEKIRIEGPWETHPRYGQQLKMENFEVVLPSTIEGVKNYLKSGVIKGIGPKAADSLVKEFGEGVFDIIEKNPEKLKKVKGIGKAKALLISSAWKEHHAARCLMGFLGGFGVKASLCAMIIRSVGFNAEEAIRENPWILARELGAEGFVAAERIGSKLEFPIDFPERVMACLMNALYKAADAGHVYLENEKLVVFCEKKFGIGSQALEDGIDFLCQENELAREGDDIFLYSLLKAEKGTAQRIKALLSIPAIPLITDSSAISESVMKKIGIAPSQEQLEVLIKIFSSGSLNVSIITGGPGTGKTTLIRSIKAVFESARRKVLLAAPTGRAARRLSDVAGKEASTIHRLLWYNHADGDFYKNQDEPLDADAVIIDEASMVDVMLMHRLVSAVRPGAALVLVGDVFQLPSIGPGNVLADLIASGSVPVFYLTEIFRQAEESAIIQNAHCVRNGEVPDLEARGFAEESDFFFIEVPDPEAAAKRIENLCANEIPNVFNLDPVHDIQVLTPMHKGPAGTISLNQRLQRRLNRGPSMMGKFSYGFRPKDKVMHLKNNYTKEVFNGDIGTVVDMDAKQGTVSVDFYGRHVEYTKDELEELALAYAVTVHKSQGSEYPAVVVALLRQHYPLLQRNLLYTAMTRGKGLVVIVGATKAFRTALMNDRPGSRLSKLAERLASA